MDGSIAPPGSIQESATLSYEIIEQILGRLAFSSMVVAKAVCKQWNATISSPQYLDSMAQMHSSQPWFFIFSKDITESLGYDPITNTWYSFPLPEPPSNMNIINIFPTLRERSMWTFIACNDNLSTHSLLCCNSLAKRPWIEMATPACMERLARSMSYVSPLFRGTVVIQNHSTGASLPMTMDIIIWILSASRWPNPLQLQIHVFNCSNHYEECREPKEATLPDWDRVESSVIWNGIIYCTVVASISMNSNALMGNYNTNMIQKHGVLAYHVSDGSLTQLSAPMPCSFTKTVLLNCKERVVMVGGIQQFYGRVKGIGIWELGEGAKEWVEIGRMSGSNFKKFGAKTDFNACGSGDLIYFHCVDVSPLRLIIFNVPHRSWLWSSHPTPIAPHPLLSCAFVPTL